tara:strand:- start:397 stop:888 length:492 start_codon:yes stop_codon:yes gene_type:complete
MKIDKYYVAAAVALLVILVIVFAQRSDWDKNRFILSTDSKGNLTSVSEGHFENEEKRFMAKAEGQVKHINDARLMEAIALNYGYVRTHCVPPFDCKGEELNRAGRGNANNGPSARAPGHYDFHQKVAWCFSQHCAGQPCTYNLSHNSCNRKKWMQPGLFRKAF